jgi:hypothetical protein
MGRTGGGHAGGGGRAAAALRHRIAGEGAGFSYVRARYGGWRWSAAGPVVTHGWRAYCRGRWGTTRPVAYQAPAVGGEPSFDPRVQKRPGPHFRVGARGKTTPCHPVVVNTLPSAAFARGTPATRGPPGGHGGGRSLPGARGKRPKPSGFSRVDLPTRFGRGPDALATASGPAGHPGPRVRPWGRRRCRRGRGPVPNLSSGSKLAGCRTADSGNPRVRVPRLAA